MPSKFSRLEKIVICMSIAFAVCFALPATVSAMHIMEGYLPVGYCVLWGAICVPFLIIGFIRIKKIIRENRRALILLAMSGAFIFVLSSLKIPSVTGSCSHMTGTGLSTILFGVTSTSILGIIVLIFQAILLAHGGLTTLGANCFSMAIGGPIITWLLYKGGTGLKINRSFTIFIATMLGDWFTYCITAFQLALAYPSQVGGIPASAVKFLSVYAPTQVPLSIVEGILSVLIVIGLESFASRELSAISYGEAK